MLSFVIVEVLPLKVSGIFKIVKKNPMAHLRDALIMKGTGIVLKIFVYPSSKLLNFFLHNLKA